MSKIVCPGCRCVMTCPLCTPPEPGVDEADKEEDNGSD